VTTRDELLSMYRQMLLIRRFEEASAKAYSQGKIGGFLHLYIGQEAAPWAPSGRSSPQDYVFGTYRDHGTRLSAGA
jgi:pyruvate dehydrogenase E1 component alpha subunit